jgi:hypothetical protein
VPFRNPGEALNAAQVNPQLIAQLTPRLIVKGITFEVHLDCEIDGIHRQYSAILRRDGPRNIQVLTFHWKLTKPDAPAIHADAR